MTHPVLGTWSDGSAVKLDLPRLIETRMLIQSNSGGGKSRALRRLLEVTSGKVQQLIIDPEGEFASLREKHDLVICAAQGGDAATHPRTAALLGRRLLELEASAVLDISELKAPERHAFVRHFLESLIEAPKSLRHSVLVVIDECQIYSPEKGQGESEANAAVIDLATRGRKRGLSLIAATQRISMLHKAVAGECKNRLIGGTSLDVDVKRAAFDLGLPPKDALEQLRALEPGHFFAFGPALRQLAPREMVTGDVLTTHPKVGHRQWTAPPKPTAAIVALLPKLSDLPKEAAQEAKSLEDLRRELTRLRRELAMAKRAAPSDTTDEKTTLAALRKAKASIRQFRDAIEAAMKFLVKINASGFAEKTGADPEALRKAIDSAVGQAIKLIDQKLASRAKDLQALQREGGRLIANIQKLLSGDQDVTIAVDVKHSEPFRVAATVASKTSRSNGEYAGNGRLPPGESAVLRACIQFPDGLRREQLTVLTGYKRSSRDAYVQRLREKAFVTADNDRVAATDEGRAALPDAEPLPTGVALQEFWMQRLPEGERKILGELIASYPDSIERSQLDERIGYQRSSRDAYLQRLRAKQLISEPSRGQVAASEALFS